LLGDAALGGAGAERGLRDLDGGARLVERDAGAGALAIERLGAVEVGLRLGKLGFQAGDLGVERVDLQDELVVADDGDRRRPAPRGWRACRRCVRGRARRWGSRRLRRPPSRR
jgi:hypothetical protein